MTGWQSIKNIVGFIRGSHDLKTVFSNHNLTISFPPFLCLIHSCAWRKENEEKKKGRQTDTHTHSRGWGEQACQCVSADTPPMAASICTRQRTTRMSGFSLIFVIWELNSDPEACSKNTSISWAISLVQSQHLKSKMLTQSKSFDHKQEICIL